MSLDPAVRMQDGALYESKNFMTFNSTAHFGKQGLSAAPSDSDMGSLCAAGAATTLINRGRTRPAICREMLEMQRATCQLTRA
jgi:hypothetical protein